MSFSTTSKLASEASPPIFFKTLHPNWAALPSVRKYSGASKRKLNEMASILISSAMINAKCDPARGASISISARNSNGSLKPPARDSFSNFPPSMHFVSTVITFNTSDSFISITIRILLSTALAPRSTDPSLPAPINSSMESTASSVSPPTKYSLKIFLALVLHSSGLRYTTSFFAGFLGSFVSSAFSAMPVRLPEEVLLFDFRSDPEPERMSYPSDRLRIRVLEEALRPIFFTVVNPSSSTLGSAFCLFNVRISGALDRLPPMDFKLFAEELRRERFSSLATSL
mmetsp:Transcript_16002/g.21047  ORF Transcript_16002/g.21047 Transcript_16002/m.21047 type:complete len:285 (+) Transcript_16002:190-1044(+)